MVMSPRNVAFKATCPCSSKRKPSAYRCLRQSRIKTKPSAYHCHRQLQLRFQRLFALCFQQLHHGGSFRNQATSRRANQRYKLHRRSAGCRNNKPLRINVNISDWTSLVRGPSDLKACGYASNRAGSQKDAGRRLQRPKRRNFRTHVVRCPSRPAFRGAWA